MQKQDNENAGLAVQLLTSVASSSTSLILFIEAVESQEVALLQEKYSIARELN